MKTIALILMLLALLTGCDKQNLKIFKIKVWDSKFKLLQTISQKKEINKIKNIWANKQNVKPKRKPNYTYSLDIVIDGKSTRWRYDKLGYVTILSKAKTPIYQLNKSEFNKIIIP